ncbi:DUF4345 domain-containing protein [Streptomyces sp. TRM66268-LWL]|uniref:DUF4345 domain-containing protein n=1 Tax=Streptomyces polyasparticus TaxID=2767826 RepID=A0ABR7SPT0_9ACTN|nr:DUF4345 domain-containing protein [Streptomyces polyasparticus]MBC9717495.1 DUF4345 domain-containing protein [Streptomyces polyasparticus]
MARALRMSAWVMGVACVAIGLFHVAGGNAAIPGEADAGATLDSLGRFFGAIFAGYGLVWIWAVRQETVPARVVRWLAAVFLLGGIGRLLSLAVHGWPHSFQVALTVLELALPSVWFWLADADERASRERAQHVQAAGGAVPSRSTAR